MRSHSRSTGDPHESGPLPSQREALGSRYPRLGEAWRQTHGRELATRVQACWTYDCIRPLSQHRRHLQISPLLDLRCLDLQRVKKAKVQDITVRALGWLPLLGYVVTLLGAFLLDRCLNRRFYVRLGPIDLGDSLLLQVLLSISNYREDFFRHHIPLHIPIN